MQLVLNHLFSDGMILQRNKKIKVYGEASSKIVTVEFDGDMASTEVVDGRWCIELPSHKEAMNLSMKITSGNEYIEINDIAVGEVFIGGGQSNMEFYLRFDHYFYQGIYPKFNDRIRFYDVPELSYPGQINDFDYSEMGKWRKATSLEDLQYFSAVGYYFSSVIERDENVPVGIIGCNWGGTNIAPWMKPETVKKVGKQWWDFCEKALNGIDMDQYYEMQHHDPSNNSSNQMKKSSNEYMIPVTRTTEEILEFQKKQAQMNQNQDQSVGGLSIGNVEKPKIRPKQLCGAMYEQMVKRISDYPVRGVLFYQGESEDITEFGPYIYADMMEGLVQDWRELWQDEKLPFIFVQLPPFEQWMGLKSINLVTIRQKQQEAIERLKNAYMINIGDFGARYDVHPKNKKPVGERLALCAKKHIFGHNILADSPKAISYKRNENDIIVIIENAGDGLYIDETWNTFLKVENELGQNVDFSYEVKGNEIVYHCEGLQNLKLIVSYGWENWYHANIFNSANLPLMPFRSELL